MFVTRAWFQSVQSFVLFADDCPREEHRTVVSKTFLILGDGKLSAEKSKLELSPLITVWLPVMCKIFGATLKRENDNYKSQNDTIMILLSSKYYCYIL